MTILTCEVIGIIIYGYIYGHSITYFIFYFIHTEDKVFFILTVCTNLTLTMQYFPFDKMTEVFSVIEQNGRQSPSLINTLAANIMYTVHENVSKYIILPFWIPFGKLDVLKQ